MEGLGKYRRVSLRNLLLVYLRRFQKVLCCCFQISSHLVRNGWVFVSASVWKNSVNIAIGKGGTFRSIRALKSLNRIKRIKLRMICAIKCNLMAMPAQQSFLATVSPMPMLKWISSPSTSNDLTSAAISHLLKGMSIYVERRRGLQLKIYQSFENMIFLIKRNFFQVVAVSVLLYGCTTWTLKNARRKS